MKVEPDVQLVVEEYPDRRYYLRTNDVEMHAIIRLERGTRSKP